MTNKWIEPGSECGLCKRQKREGERWSDWHTNTGISGFTFNFCNECEKNREEECLNVMSECITEYRRKVKEYWDAHPEELAERKRETAIYRETCLDIDGLPFDCYRPFYTRIWNWIWRTLGYRKKYEY